MTKRMIYVGFPKNDYPIPIGKGILAFSGKKWVEGNSSVPFCK